MRALRLQRLALRFGLLGPALLLSACQVIAPRSAPPPSLLNDPTGVSVAGVTAGPAAANAPAVTYTIKRDTLRESLALSGKVVPGRSAQVILHGSGTVSAVYVTQGQSVKEGEALAEYVLDDDSLQAARAQATLADLAYQSEQAKLDELQRAGGNTDAVQQLRITIERDQAEIQKLEGEQAATRATNNRAEQTRTAAQSAADRKVALAEGALQAAQDGVAAAQASVKRAQDDTVAAQDQARADADAAATAATGAVRMAARLVDEAAAKLDQSKAGLATIKATQQLETQQLRVDQDKEVLADARAALEAATGQSPSIDHPARQIAAEVSTASGAVRAAQRTLATDSLELKHMNGTIEGAKASDAADVKATTYALDAAKEQVASLQQAEQRAQQKAQTLAKNAASTPAHPSQQSSESAQAAVKQAEATVHTAELNLEDARGAQAAAADPTTPVQFADHALGAAQAQLSADQAKLATQLAGNSATEVARQQTRVGLLHDQANAAAAAAQPVVTLKAPFNGTVADVGVSAGQAIAPGGQVVASANDPQANRSPAIRVVAAGANSIVADASEADVAQLNRGQTMDLTFPGLPGQTAAGTIAEVGGTATVKDNQVSYPVRIDMPLPPPTLKFGMTAQASIAVSEAKDVLVAPRRAIRTTGGQTTVDKLGSSGQVVGVPVQVGRTFGANVELLNGLQEGDVIAVYEPGLAAPTSKPQP
jgi:HlyD family secretion protein